METAGFVLAGGRSIRMGMDKALIPWGNSTLLEHMARLVISAAGSVGICGSPEKYRQFGYPVIPDMYLGLGPISGVHAALAGTKVRWNLILACDMPRLTVDFLADLLNEAKRTDALCLVPRSERGPEPLCAVWRSDALDGVEAAIRARRLKMQDLIHSLGAALKPCPDMVQFRNLNSPGDLSHVQADQLH